MSNITNLNRDYLIKINVKEATIDVPKMTFWNTDKKTSNMFVQLVINMSTNELISQYVTVQNATDYKITLNVIKPKTKQYKTIEATLLNEEKALFEIDLPDEFTDQVGDYSFEFEVSSKVDSNDESITTSNGTYKVNGSILTNLNEETSSSPDLPILKQLIEQVKSLQGGDLTGYQKKNDAAQKTIVEDGKLYLTKLDGTKLDDGTTLPTGSGTSIDDTNTTTDKTWSSSKIDSQFKENQINLIEDDTSMEGISDSEHDTLETDNKKIIPAINEVNKKCKDIAKQTITTEERTKLTNLENYDDTSVKTDIQSVQQQVNNLVLGAVGDGNNAEVVQARGGYNTLNDRMDDNDKLLGSVCNTYKSDSLEITLPKTIDFSSSTGWLYTAIPVAKKWQNYESAFMAIDISYDNTVANKIYTSNMNIYAKTTDNKSVGESEQLFTGEGVQPNKRYTLLFKLTINKTEVDKYPTADKLFIQFGDSATIGTPIATIHNIFLTSWTDTIQQDFSKNGFNTINELQYDKLNKKPKIDGIELTDSTTMREFEKPIMDIVDKKLNHSIDIVYKNYASSYDISTLKMSAIDNGWIDVSSTLNEGIPTFNYTNTSSSCFICTNNLNIPNFEFQANHTYLIAIKVKLIKYKTSTTDSTAGNMSMSMWQPTSLPYEGSSICSNCNIVSDIATVGADSNIVSICTIDSAKLESAKQKNSLFLQSVYITEPNCEFNMQVKDIAVIDLTELNLNNKAGEELFNKYQYTKDIIKTDTYNFTVQNSVKAESAAIADSVKSMKVSSDIEMWGDSLVAQGYGSYIEEYLGRNVWSKGYGGKTSTYIRDKFLAEADTSKTIIINVGRNNYQEPDVVIQDIRKMVEVIPHNNFLICCPPNGNFGGINAEGSGSDQYKSFQLIEDRLSKQYQSNFLNTRVNTIQEYDMGNVKLVEPFIQPAINSQVTIKVDNAKFLTTVNEYDKNIWGAELMNKIVIGQSIYNVDVYKIDSSDLTNNTLTITLLENNSSVKPGSTVDNGIDNGGLNSKKYLRVLQYADYHCFMHDITQSTFRMDGIHMTENGRKCLAKVIARKITTMKI